MPSYSKKWRLHMTGLLSLRAQSCPLSLHQVEVVRHICLRADLRRALRMHRQAQLLDLSAAWEVQQRPARRGRPREQGMAHSWEQMQGSQTRLQLPFQATQLPMDPWQLAVRRRCSFMAPASI